MYILPLWFARFFVVTTSKRSLVQGNIFTPVCHSVHGVGVVCIQGGLPPGEGSASRGSASWGGSASREVCLCWVCIQGGLHPMGSASIGVCLLGGSVSVVGGEVGQTPQRALQDTVNKRAERILLECILVYLCFCSLLLFPLDSMIYCLY